MERALQPTYPYPPAKPVALVRGSVLAPVVEILVSRGAPIAALLEQAGLPTRGLQDERLIPLRQGFRFLADAARMERLPELGLIAGEAASIAGMGVLGRLLRRAATLGDALATLFAVTGTFTSGERWWLDVQDARAFLCHTFLDAPPYGHEQADHYGVALSINLVRTVAGPDWTPEEVQFETGPVVEVAERTALFRGTRISFSRPFSGIAFPAELLSRSLPTLASARQHDDELDHWYATAPAPDFAGSVQQVMWSFTSENGHPCARRTAAALGVSVRTLQRRLAATGLSFEHLLRAQRLRMASWYLARTDARVLDIALDLGYSDHAHFTRAFRRWTGLTPLDYRRARSARAQSVTSRGSQRAASLAGAADRHG
jgi:AraC-like DNA-binding protein